VVGWNSLSPATIRSSGWVTGKRALWTIGLAKVCAIELVMWVACWAATKAMVLGSPVSPGLTARSQSRWRM
jgi:hypothetical protein